MFETPLKYYNDIKPTMLNSFFLAERKFPDRSATLTLLPRMHRSKSARFKTLFHFSTVVLRFHLSALEKIARVS